MIYVSMGRKIEQTRQESNVAGMAVAVTDPATGYGVVTLMNTKHPELRLPIPEMILSHLQK